MKNLRNEIDKLDLEIVQLLEKRFDVVKEIAKFKIKNNIPVYDPERETQVLEKSLNNLENKEYFDEIEKIFKQIMASSKTYQNQIIKEEQFYSDRKSVV